MCNPGDAAGPDGGVRTGSRAGQRYGFLRFFPWECLCFSEERKEMQKDEDAVFECQPAQGRGCGTDVGGDGRRGAGAGSRGGVRTGVESVGAGVHGVYGVPGRGAVRAAAG